MKQIRWGRLRWGSYVMAFHWRRRSFTINGERCWPQPDGWLASYHHEGD
jgi:hypothetical protein